MQWLGGILALLIGIAGWYYLFYSRAAQKLTGVEDTANNLKRIRLRRIAGFLLLLLGGFFYAGFKALEPEASGAFFLVTWGAVLVILLLVLMLGLLDLRYTLQFYRDRRNRRS